jgi:hypothetical protein
MQQQEIVQEVAGYWKGLMVTLRQRGLLQTRPQRGGAIYPEALALLLPDRAVFVLDMQKLGGIAREAWLDHDLWRQWRATLQGRRVFVSDGGGLAITVARQPGTPKKKLPGVITLGEEHLTEKAYHVAAGVDVRHREPVTLDVAGEHRAMLIGGYTGSGKTNLMLSILLQLVSKHDADELRVAIVDVKEVDFSGAFDEMPQLFQPIARDLEDAERLIEQVEGERIRRQAHLRQAGVRNWQQYNEKAKEAGVDPLPLLLLMVDEAADFAGTTVMETLVQIARKGRALGVSLIIGTQYPTKKVIDPQVKANLPTAIAFQTTTGTESRVIINRNGAEHLRQPGRCLTFLDGRWCEIQTFFVGEQTDTVAQEASLDRAPSLPPLHVAMVTHALEELDGEFIINRLYEAFKGKISKYRLEGLAQQWEARGWLTKPEHRADPRRVTDELVSLCTAPAPSGEKS